MVRIPLSLAVLLLAGGALAQTPPPAAAQTPAVIKAPARPVQSAQVKKTRKKVAKKPAPPPLPTVGGPIASTPSFRMLDEGKSRVFLEVSQKVDVAEQKAKGRVVYKLKGASVPPRNSFFPLVTGFFATPVGQVTLAAENDGAALIIDLREAAQPVYRVIETPRGVALQVDFPAVAKAPSPGE